MTRWNALVGLLPVGFVLAFGPTPALPADGISTIRHHDLVVCLPRNAGVIAGRRAQGGSGFDFRVAEEVATRLGFDLDIIWFEDEREEESDPVRETYAMLSYGLCDLVPGHPRYAGAVGAPSYDRASLPRWLGMPQEIDARTGFLQDRLAGFVDVAPIAVTKGYMRSTIGLVYRDGAPEPTDLSDLDGRRLAFQQGTLSGAIAMIQLTSGDRTRARHFNPGSTFLWEVETSNAELAIVDIAAFDSYRKSNPATRLKLGKWRHPLGIDIGMAVLASNTKLVEAIDRVLYDILREGRMSDLAEAEGLTYTPPQSDELTSQFTLQTLLTSP
ncbi:MAG: transporter substrate-binding domain-containing protein [Pseudomonadota bacterium]